MTAAPLLSQAREMIAQGRRRAAARLLLAEGSSEAAGLLDGMAPDGPHGAVLAERLRFGPPETWAGWRKGVGRVAVKLWPGPAAQPGADFRHPLVAPMLASGPDWRVTGWVEGVTLAAWLRQSWSLDAAASMLADLEEAVEALLAAGLAHGDLTPANVVVTAAGRAVLIDWGEEVDAPGDPAARDRHALTRLAALLLSGTPAAASRS